MKTKCAGKMYGLFEIGHRQGGSTRRRYFGVYCREHAVGFIKAGHPFDVVDAPLSMCQKYASAPVVGGMTRGKPKDVQGEYVTAPWVGSSDPYRGREKPGADD